MKTRVVLYGENDVPLSTLGENPQEKVKMAWDAVIAVLSLNTTDGLKVESVEAWDDAPQTDGILFKGDLKEGYYKLIKTTDGWALAGEDIVYAGWEKK